MTISTALFANNAISNLADPINATATTANLLAGTGSLFPNPGVDQYFVGTFVDAATGILREIVHGNENVQGSNVDNAYGYPVNNTTYFIATKSSSTGGSTNYPCYWLAIGS